jgi:hypothetical protein
MPGKTEREVDAEARKVLRELGYVDGTAHATHEDPPFIRPSVDRRIERTDIIKFSMEVTRPRVTRGGSHQAHSARG